MRTFIAIELPANIHIQLSAIQDSLKSTISDCKWVQHAGFHITLKFLGETNDEEISHVSNILDRVVKSITPFNISIKNLGVFPNIKRPRVLWIGAEEGCENIENLYNKIESEIKQNKFLCGKKFDVVTRFHPHITIGRFKDRRGKGTKAQRHKGTEELSIVDCRLSIENSNNQQPTTNNYFQSTERRTQNTDAVDSGQLAGRDAQFGRLYNRKLSNYQITKLPNHHQPSAISHQPEYFIAKSITLFKSELHREGAVYTVIKEFKFCQL